MISGTTQLLQRGLKLNDYCTVVPAGGNRRRITLGRTAWDIVPEGTVVGPKPSIFVPGARPGEFHWRLELVGLSEGEERFLLKSVDGSLFRLNGQLAREAFVEGRDVLCTDSPCRLEFSAQDLNAQFAPPAWAAILDDEPMLRSNLPVLLEGETGTGKGYLAREIHRRSECTGSFVAVNVQAFAAGLAEAELFGHKKGSFTGALQDRKGAIAQAEGGTLFIDEVDSLGRDMQTKLLLFLDDRTYRAVGGQREEQARVRLIFASGRPLQQVVAKGEMRPDFYFRLKQGLAVELRPLRENPQEIRRHCELFGIEQNVVVGEKLTQFYLTLPWPGNVRQLRGHLAAKKVRARSRKLDFDALDESLVTMSGDLVSLAKTESEVRPMEEVKRAYAQWAYDRCQGEMRWTAAKLGVNARTLKQWLGTSALVS